MQVPRLVPLEGPWSPVGYQVVELTDEGKPASAATAKANDRAPAPRHRAPLGCRAVHVAEEKPVVLLPAPRRRTGDQRLAMRPPPRCGIPLVPIVGGVFAVFAVILVLVCFLVFTVRAARRDRPNLPARVALLPEPPQIALPERAEDVKLPEQLAPEGENVAGEAGEPAGKPADALAAPVGPPALAGPPAFETFGTMVRFASSPAEAARLARAESKLTFLLHVSGNFEEACFT